MPVCNSIASTTGARTWEPRQASQASSPRSTITLSISGSICVPLPVGESVSKKKSKK
jgi:hypothetical protein